jgi:hypothetical protein
MPLRQLKESVRRLFRKSLCNLIPRIERLLQGEVRLDSLLDLVKSKTEFTRRTRWSPAARVGSPRGKYFERLSDRGTSTLLNNALLSAHFRLADNAGAIYPVLGFLSGEGGSRLPDIANARCSCLSLTRDLLGQSLRPSPG